MTYKIYKPIWNQRQIGIALFRLHYRIDLEIEVLYKDKHGNRIYPHIYLLNLPEAIDCPRQTRKGVELAIIPIDKLRIKGG
jgi:hypothetical protein